MWILIYLKERFKGFGGGGGGVGDKRNEERILIISILRRKIRGEVLFFYLTCNLALV